MQGQHGIDGELVGRGTGPMGKRQKASHHKGGKNQAETSRSLSLLPAQDASLQSLRQVDI